MSIKIRQGTDGQVWRQVSLAELAAVLPPDRQAAALTGGTVDAASATVEFGPEGWAKVVELRHQRCPSCAG